MNTKFLILILVSGIGSIATVAYASNTTITNTSVSTTTINTSDLAASYDVNTTNLIVTGTCSGCGAHVAKNGTSSGGSFLPTVWREQAASPFVIKFGITNLFNWQNDVNLDPDFIFDSTIRHEPQIASSRSSSNPDVLVEGSIEKDSRGSHCQVSRSLNSGLNWNDGSFTAGHPGGLSIGGDPTITSLLNGTFVYACLGDITTNGVLTNSAIGYAKSSDNGMTWGSETDFVVRPANDPIQVDKPWIAADWGAFTKYNNRVYACWTVFDYQNHMTKIEFAQILPSISNEVTIDSASWVDDSNRAKGPYVQGCQIATGPGKAGVGNELFLAYEKVNDFSSGQILFNRNYNGGNSSSWRGTSLVIGTFQRFVAVSACNVGNAIIDGCLTDSMGNYFRASHIPYLAVDKLGGPHVVWTTYVNNNADIVYTSSYNCAVNQGQCNFAPQVTMDSNPNDQFEPSIVASDSNVNPRGIIIVTENDKRDDPSNQSWKPYSYWCRPTSISGADSCQNASDWSTLKIADDVTTTTESFVGDYHGTTYSRSNQAVSMYYFQKTCSFPCFEDIHSLGAK